MASCGLWLGPSVTLVHRAGPSAMADTGASTFYNGRYFWVVVCQDVERLRFEKQQVDGKLWTVVQHCDTTASCRWYWSVAWVYLQRLILVSCGVLGCGTVEVREAAADTCELWWCARTLNVWGLRSSRLTPSCGLCQQCPALSTCHSRTVTTDGQSSPAGYVHIVTTTHTHTFNGPLSRTTRVSRYEKGKTNLDFTEARDSGWQWHQLDHMQVCTSLQTDNHTSTQPLSFLQAGCPSCHPTNSVKALKAILLLLLELFTLDNTSSHTYIQPFFPGLRGKPVPER